MVHSEKKSQLHQNLQLPQLKVTAKIKSEFRMKTSRIHLVFTIDEAIPMSTDFDVTFCNVKEAKTQRQKKGPEIVFLLKKSLF